MTFKEKLTELKAYRKDRLELADWIIAHPWEFENLLHYCFQVDDDISYKAAWVLEMACLQKLDILYPYLDVFLEHLPKVYKNQAVRPLTKVCELIADGYYGKNPHSVKQILTLNQRKQLTETCFDWLISDQKVACKAYAMQCLFLLGKEFQWIHPALKTILEKDFSAGLPAFKARARNILRKLS